jgi:uncharacterized protein (DUF58 family)
MIPTARFFLLAGLAPLLPLLGGGSAAAQQLAWIAAGAALLLWLLDGAISLTRPRLEFERHAPGDLYVAQRHAVEWRITNRSGFAIEALLRDEVPADCTAEPALCAGRLRPRAVTRLGYSLTPAERGDGAFGSLHYRIRGPLGLAWLQRRIAAPRPVRIFPQFANWKAAEIAERQAMIRQAGSHRHRWRGAGTMFETLREYSPEDDIRWLDWKATARLQRPVSRNFEVERHQTVLILLDASRMMTTYCGRRTKFDAALESAVLLARTAVNQGDHAGLMVFSDKVERYIPPRRERREVGDYLSRLYALFPRLVEPDYEAAIQTAALRNRRRSLIILFTDVTNRESARRMVAHLASLVPRHVPMVVTIADETIQALEQTPPEQPEDVYAAGVAADLGRERDETLEQLRVGGVAVLDAPADRMAIQVIERYLSLKRRVRL